MSPSEWLDSQGRFGGPRGASGERLTHRAGDKFFHLRRGAASEPRHIHRLHEITQFRAAAPKFATQNFAGTELAVGKQTQKEEGGLAF